MNKLCLVISSVYDKRLPSFFNDEVQQDFELIQQTLNDHHVINICVPVNAKLKSSILRIQGMLDFLNVSNFSDCHIILNTHGSPGYSDIKQECVIFIVNYLSKWHLKISQISALQCDGMTSGFNSQASVYRVFWEDRKRVPLKREADLVRLQKKLSALVLESSQQFQIRGFEQAYTPSESRVEVQAMLQGTGGDALNVEIKAKENSKAYLCQILLNIEKMRCPDTLTKLEHQELSNFFGKLLHHMKQEMLFAIQQRQIPDETSEFYPLFRAILAHGHSLLSNFDFSSPRQVEAIYKNWLKTYKFQSEERLSIFEDYTKVALDKLQASESFKLVP